MHTSVEGPEAARQAGLRYVSDSEPGIHRQRRGRGFDYRLPDGSRLSGETELERIRSLAIPPAWTDVWISPHARGHVQATGRDRRGRKQYRYHPRWREVRDETKYGRLVDFARALPRIRRRVARDLRQPRLPREKVLAVVVRLLETTLLRIGNEEYAQHNGSFGLTTLRSRHAEVGRSSVRFYFRGKHGAEHAVGLRDRRLARVIKQCQDLPGQALFQYLDEDGERRRIDSDDVNEYLRAAAGDDFTAKDFRTWAGTVLAVRALRSAEAASSEGRTKHNVVAAIDAVARQLGNTRAVCRKCYVHPAVIESYLDGTLIEALQDRSEEAGVVVLLERLQGRHRAA